VISINPEGVAAFDTERKRSQDSRGATTLSFAAQPLRGGLKIDLESARVNAMLPIFSSFHFSFSCPSQYELAVIGDRFPDSRV
jgi:hypothetical protein